MNIKIHNVGYNYVHDKGILVNRPNGSGDYLFLFIKEKCDILINDELITLTEPSFLLYKKGTPQYYTSGHDPYCNDWMQFDGEGIEEFIEKLHIPYNTLMTIQNSLLISEYFKDITTEFCSDGKYHDDILDLKCKTMLYKFSDIYHREHILSEQLSRYIRSFSDIRARIYSSPTTPVTVPEIASKLSLSTSYFQHIYKKLFGVSVIRDIIQSRIDFACYLLTINQDSINVIALQCGYENKEHFTRQFKEVTGYTPKQYRLAKTEIGELKHNE